jgi:hypothetical protein
VTRLMYSAGLFFALTVTAYGEGALAIGIPEDGLRNGFAFGWRVDASSASIAESGAMEICSEQARKYGVPPSRCKIVSSFKGRCVSVAFDGRERWAGWAVEDSRDEAIAGALRKCGEGAGNCKTFDTDCDR